jgi:hypothetical protein
MASAAWYSRVKSDEGACVLDRERAHFAAHSAEWLADHWGAFVVVKYEMVVGFFATHEQALAEGARRFGLSPFLVRQVGAVPETITVPALTLGLLGARLTA